MLSRSLLTLIALATAGLRSPAGEPAPRFALRDGDRVVLIGGGLIEQERRHGHLEARLSRHLPEGALVFRNLGWAGDTVRGSARTSGFQNPEGLARLLKEVQDHKPTVLISGYGMNEAFDGPAGLPGFREDYAKLLAKLAPLKARTVLLSPTFQEDLGRPFPDPAAHNRNVASYAAGVRQLAQEHKAVFVDLTQPLQDEKKRREVAVITTNGLQLNETGSLLMARVVEKQLGLPELTMVVNVEIGGKVFHGDRVRFEQYKATADGISFRLTDKILIAQGEEQVLRIVGLPAGSYALKIDGKPNVTRSAADWQVTRSSDAYAEDFEKLRQAIVVNNDLFYRRWRPFNDHSRHWDFIGGDGKLYDRDMAAQGKVIAELRRPRAHQYEIVRTGDAK